jgi:hypothetical protein
MPCPSSERLRPPRIGSIAPLAPATNTRIVLPFGHMNRDTRVYCHDPPRRPDVTDG